MDDRRFDDLARTIGGETNRRLALKGFVGGLLGLGIGQRLAAAQDGSVGAEGCDIQRCRKQQLGDRCLDQSGRPKNHKCCQGLKCKNRTGKCVFKNNHGEQGDWCKNNQDCDRDLCCKKNQCVPDRCCGRR